MSTATEFYEKLQKEPFNKRIKQLQEMVDLFNLVIKYLEKSRDMDSFYLAMSPTYDSYLNSEVFYVLGLYKITCLRPLKHEIPEDEFKAPSSPSHD